MDRLYDRCVRCGTRVPYGRAVCRSCNPADLPAPSPAQYHATVFLTVIGVAVVMTLVLLVRG
jgi:hypothetical protein